MIIIDGVAASKGVAIGPAHIIGGDENTINNLKFDDAQTQLKRFADAKQKAIAQIRSIIDNTKHLSKDQLQIFETHIMMIEDIDYNQHIEKCIKEQHLTAEKATVDAKNKFEAMFSSIDDSYMKERAIDITDISNRIITILSGGEKDVQSKDKAILVATNLTPSQTVLLDKSKILAFVTQQGASGSHTSILARTLGIPAVVGLGDSYKKITQGKTLIVDGIKGKIIINPDAKTTTRYERILERDRFRRHQLDLAKSGPAVTIDGTHIEVNANVGSIKDIEDYVKDSGADGIGLLRSELLYIESSDFPDEDKLFESYKTALEAMKNKRVIIRTLDIGADKQVDYLGLKTEENPALGYRAIRICLDDQQLFLTQLRALYRASTYGRLAIMLPMIVTIDEVKQSFKLIETAKKQLTERGVKYDPDVEVGVMIETPASVMISDELAQLVDFFSVGTNDLTQYVMACDRLNSKVSNLFNPADKAVMRMIKIAADSALAHGKWIGICGESAADINLTPEYLAMGITELSMVPGSVAEVKNAVRHIDITRAKKMTAEED